MKVVVHEVRTYMGSDFKFEARTVGGFRQEIAEMLKQLEGVEDEEGCTVDLRNGCIEITLENGVVGTDY